MSITVKALELGYYGMKRRKAGDVFQIENEQAFSKKWMQKVKSAKDEEAGEKQRAKDEASADRERAKDQEAEEKQQAKDEAAAHRKHPAHGK